MNDRSFQKARTHNTVLGIITVASIGTISGSSALGWEYWVPPLIIIGLIATWALHISQYGTATFRENYYLIFTMLLSFFHGVHQTSYFDIAIVSALLMVNVTLLRRREFVSLMLIEYFFLQVTQVIMGVRSGTTELNTLTVSRLMLDVVAELCIYKGLSDVIRNNRIDTDEADRLTMEKESARSEMEDFLVNISHELRTPVNVINGMSTLLLKQEKSDDVAAIRDAGLRLSRQIEDIQDYSEIQRGDVLLEEERYMITSLLNDIVTEFRVRENMRGAELVVDLDPNVPAMLKGDIRKISKILRHLLDNAVKFTRQGGMRLRVYSERKEYGINLVLEVSDTGIGMSRTEIERVSRGLYQENKKRNRSTGGIGLGLSIVYGFVRRMNGFVNLESRRGKGTTVRVTIAQEIVDPAPCLSVESERFLNTAVYLNVSKFATPELAEYYRQMVVHLATGLRLNLYSAPTLSELKRLVERGGLTNIFTGPEEYLATPDYYDALAANDIVVAVSAPDDFSVRKGSRVIVMPKPLSGFPVVRILSGDA
ncbi:MAG: HAMP domain-containing histidine kinase, partial [Lachnospiraceae bacterium]|nr:HAMP domain-containing histidine kinase [Lachnospiraceae bacterium]